MVDGMIKGSLHLRACLLPAVWSSFQADYHCHCSPSSCSSTAIQPYVCIEAVNSLTQLMGDHSRHLL